MKILRDAADDVMLAVRTLRDTSTRMSVVTVTARIASTHPVPKYPGWQLSRQVLEDLAARLKTGNVPMLFDHDAREPVVARTLDANVIALDPSHWALEAEFEVDADAWAQIQDRFDEAGVPGGFSFTATAPQAAPPGGSASVILAADAAAWTDCDRAEAGAILEAVVPTRIDRLFQYSAIDLATIYLIVGSVGLSVLGNATYDVLKYLIGRRAGLTRIEIHRHNGAGDTIKAIITTDDPDIAREALGKLESEESAGPVQHFDAEKRLWLDY